MGETMGKTNRNNRKTTGPARETQPYEPEQLEGLLRECRAADIHAMLDELIREYERV